MKRLLTIPLAVAALLALTAVPANAAPVTHVYSYQVITENCSTQIVRVGHWTSASNPSDAWQFVRNPHCGKVTDVNPSVTRIE